MREGRAGARGSGCVNLGAWRLPCSLIQPLPPLGICSCGRYPSFLMSPSPSVFLQWRLRPPLPFPVLSQVEATLFQMMAGACKTLGEAGAALLGGHTCEGAELSLGFAVVGCGPPRRGLYPHRCHLPLLPPRRTAPSRHADAGTHPCVSPSPPVISHPCIYRTHAQTCLLPLCACP